MVFKSLLSVVFGLFILTSNNDEPISWKDNIKLTWNHFKGTPKTNMSAVAVTASGITFEFSVKESNDRVIGFNTTVYAHFYPGKSWYIKEQGNAHILAHEQLHFDITELYARKFRKQVAQLEVSNAIKSQLRMLHEKVNKELAEAQNTYDRETDNSVNVELQNKWNSYVKLELKKLDAYKSKD